MMTKDEIESYGINPTEATEISILLQKLLGKNPESQWELVSKKILKPNHPFAFHLALFKKIYPQGLEHPESAPIYFANSKSTNIETALKTLSISNYKELHKWSTENYKDFWKFIIEKLNIKFKTIPEKICDSTNPENPSWLVNAKLNIIESCFQANPSQTALIYEDENHHLQKLSYEELKQLTNRIANSLITLGCKSGEAIAIDMPMTKEAVAIYLAIIKIGCVVISIADSFPPEEIKIRLDIGKAQYVFTQDYIFRQQKKIPLYEKLIAANAPLCIVLENVTPLRKQDISWEKFLSSNLQDNNTFYTDPLSPINILFSSGTTGTPKAIPWNHTTPIKVASDAFFHQDIHTDDVLLWPTNLGWMMGPWILFAAFINQATLALYTNIPKDKSFGNFVQNAKVTMLGVVPTIVAYWRQTDCMKGLNWDAIRVFSSTGESSNPEDMLYLSSLAGYKPIIEYCGGTEIGGAYVTSSLAQNNYLSLCTTPALGLNFVLLNEEGEISEEGEVAIIPPSIGLSQSLLNADHHDVYYNNMPLYRDKILRRHGDHLKQFSNGLYSILGRVDDTMNLGGIKISSVEIERVLVGIPDILETAAIAKSQMGPSQLIVFAATDKNLDKEVVRKAMQEKLNHHLNPLFKIHDVIFVKELPKTASNKIMRRLLRKSQV